VRTPDSLSIPITVANTPSGVWMMSLTQTPKCFRSASAVSISFFLPLPFLPPFFGIVRVFCLRSLSQLAFNAESRYSAPCGPVHGPLPPETNHFRVYRRAFPVVHPECSLVTRRG
jgi:hypothetical protein